MDRYGLFVDAAYLYAAGGELCCGTKNRAELIMDFPIAIAELRALCVGKIAIPPLRTYWYDAATDANPTPSHLAVASLDGVQLRLGRLTSAGQKGVDSRIVRDLIVLSRNRAITDAFLVSGDDDLREGLSEAQEVGVAVHLIGVEPLQGFRNQAPTLVRAADSTHLLKRAEVGKFMSRRVITPISVAAPAQSLNMADVELVGRAFATSWRKRNSEEARLQVLKGKPIVEKDVHVELVRHAERELGSFSRKGGQELYQVVAKGFWTGLE